MHGLERRCADLGGGVAPRRPLAAMTVGRPPNSGITSGRLGTTRMKGPLATYLIVLPAAGLSAALSSMIELSLQLGLITFLIVSLLYTAVIVGVTLIARDLRSTRVSILLGTALWFIGGYLVWTSAGPRHATMYPVILPILGLLALVQLRLVALIGSVARIPQRAERHTVGHCRKCGYDLRGSNTRCPECGLLIVPGESPPPEGTG